MDNSQNILFEQIILNYKKINDNLDKYEDLIKKIHNTHSILLNKNTHHFYNFSLSLDLLYFDKLQIKNEKDYFYIYSQNGLKCLYQDLYQILKEIIKSLFQFEAKYSNKDFLQIKLKDIKHHTKLPDKREISDILLIFNLLIEYFDNYKIQINNFKTFIETDCENKQSFDIKNLIVNLNTQYKKFSIDYEGLEKLLIEILTSHSIISTNLYNKIEYSFTIQNQIKIF